MTANNGRSSKLARSRGPLTIHDVSPLITKFSGDSDIHIIQWLKQYNYVVAALNGDDIDKVRFAHQLMDGTAAIWIKQHVWTNWVDMSMALLAEFNRAIPIGDIYRRMRTRTRGDDESVTRYVAIMMDLARQHEAILPAEVIHYC